MPNVETQLEIPKPEKGFAFDSLEAVRKKLLDLTGGNRLLNYRHPTTGCVRIIDELPDQVAAEIVAGKSFAFLPVPEPTECKLIDAGYIKVDPETGDKEISEYPTAEQWAKHLGFATSYELPSKDEVNCDTGNHDDTNLQTLLYAPALESRLRNIRGKAETAIEESGANVLYLAMGFLEWFERRDSDAARLAPLFTLPVRLERASLNRQEGVYRYKITVKDEGLLTNITLQERLAQDFNLHLPDIGEDTLPEQYFETIQNSIVLHQPRWRVRRCATLVQLDFAKQVMYEDLDPANWPDGANIENHSIVRQFFSAADNDYDTGFVSASPEYDIDRIEGVHEKYPLVFEADSSQHSAMIDAVEGKNLVIEGPPGTGKSQTISNLVAACIANGKKVLFVAEKMAALNVVKDRLDKAGLGDFCLELHSHKTNKQMILHDLKVRIEKQNTYRPPDAIDADIERYEDLRRRLQEYVELINSEWRQTGLTIHQILNKATRFREQLRLNPDMLEIEGIDGRGCTLLKQKELFDQAVMLASIFDQVAQQAADGQIAKHHWYGVNNTDIMGFQIEALIQKLSQWTEKLAALGDSWRDRIAALKLAVDTETRVDVIEAFVDSLEKLPALHGDEPLSQLHVIAEQQEALEALLDDYFQIHQKIKLLCTVLKADALDQPGARDSLGDSIGALIKLGVAKSKCVAELTEYHEALLRAVNGASEIETQYGNIIPHIPEPLRPAFELTPEGLIEFATLAELIARLPAELWRYRESIFDDLDVDPVLEQLAELFQTLLPMHDQLSRYFTLNNLPTVKILRQKHAVVSRGGVFRWFSSEWRSARKAVLSYSATSKPDKKLLLDLLPKLIAYAHDIETMEQLNRASPILGDLYQGIDTPIERFATIRCWYKAVRQEYGIGFGNRVPLGTALLTLDRDVAMGVADAANQRLLALMQRVHDIVGDMRQQFVNYLPITNSRFGLCGDDSPLVELQETLANHLATLCKSVHDEQVDLWKLTAAHNHWIDLHKRIGQWQESSLVNVLVPEHINLSIEPGEYSARALTLGKNTLAIARVAAPIPAILNAISAEPNVAGYQAIKDSRARLKELIDVANEAKQQFIENGHVNYSEWTESSNGVIDLLISRNHNAINNPNWLNNWLDYVRLRDRLSSTGLARIIGSLEGNLIPSAHLIDVVHLAVYHQLANEVLAEHHPLAMFSGMEQMAIRERFQDYDKKLLQLQRQKIAYAASRTQPPAGVGRGRIRDYTETALIRHHAGLQRPRIAVRTLIKRAGRAIQSLKPCFMMSPMSVAQYLEPGQFHFDLVVMDEASQIRPEDALGAVARGDSLVVVGDPKQLPPTSFFQRAISDDDDDEAVALQVSESILDSVTPMFDRRPLLWHYRSRHESLIAFSNQHFYDSKLILFPSPFQESEEFGIRFTPVTRGRFANRRNVEEAREVVEAVAHHLTNNPKESIGIVAMNGEQRDEIILQLDYLTKDNTTLREARDRNEQSDEPIFIKNLENVQGDERDVIVISMTYGPEQAGANTMHQRFGPINTAGGWRRLNVLFTRSKKRMHVFSSMGSGHINVGYGTSKGVQALRAWLEYCETGHLHHTQHTGRPADSDFEIAVMQALEEHGYQCEPQLGVAGYFLDLAVRDPGQSGHFLMGIECDGATYHSAKSTRDRDRLRQDILEGLGWRICRIWSTDWFKNPQAQLQPILLELDKLKTEIVEMAAGVEQEVGDIGSAAATSFDDQPLFAPISQRMLLEDLDELSPSSGTVPGADGDAGIGLKERLLNFNAKVIRDRLPNTDDQHRLLRSEMIEALLHYKPCSRAEFVEYIPKYLRIATEPDEAAYLEPVLELVADYG